MVATVLHQHLDNVAEHIDRREHGINMHNHVITVVSQQRPGFLVVGLEPVFDHLFVGVIETVVPQGTPLEALDQLGPVRAGQMKNFSHPDNVLQHLRLVDVARDAVEHQKIVVGMKSVRLDALIDADLPKLDRYFVRHQFATA